jgi:endonuclease YncB( thermonuclease family)
MIRFLLPSADNEGHLQLLRRRPVVAAPLATSAHRRAELLRVVSALFLLASLVSPAFADVINGRVIGVTDGDTIRVLDAAHRQHKIRLSGIDAPERSQQFGKRAKEHLSDLVFNRDVTVEWHKLDRYERVIGKVIVNGTDANLEQVRAGYAWWYREYAREQSSSDRVAYERAEAQAKASRSGLWQDKDPTPPWEWRHSKRKPPARSSVRGG